ncbi:MAG: DUF3592 domain-containing protein [Alphaproteobacteria bacterium]
MQMNKVVAAICVLVGVILIGMAGFLSSNRVSLLIGGSTADGKVVAVNVVIGPARGCSASACSHPVVEFTTRTGQTLTFQSQFGAADAEYRRGDMVDVIYTSGPPPIAEINDFKRLWVNLLVTVALGVLLILVGVFYGRKKPPRPAGAPVRVKSNKWLEQNGYPVQVTVESIARTMMRGDTPRPGWQIVTKGPAPRGSKVLTYRSEALPFDPTDSVEIGSHMTALTDPDNPADYWVDVSDLKKKSG